MIVGRMISVFLSITIVVHPVYPIPAFSADVPKLPPNQEQTVAILTEMSALVDQSSLDPAALIERLNWDPDLILKFVQEDIEFEQYPGLLRGATGTLMSRSGNALDQAVLLATLLGDAGVDVRIAGARLSAAGAHAVLEQMPAKHVQRPDSVRDLAHFEWLARQLDAEDLMVAIRGELASESQSELVKEAASLLERTLDFQPDDSAESQRWNLVEEAKDYFWVQSRDGAAQPWQDLHPAVPMEVLPRLGVTVPARVFVDEVPEELQHQFRLRMFVEVREGGRLSTTQIVPDWQRPVANLVGRSFSFFNLPDGLGDDFFQIDAVAAISASQVITPVFNGGVIPGTKGFDLDGQIYDMDVRALDRFGVTAVIRSTAQKASKAISALGGIGSDGDTPQRLRDITAQWIEYTIIQPGGHEKTMRRYLLDRIGVAAREADSIASLSLDRPTAWDLLASESFSVVPGRLPASLVAQEFVVSRTAANEIEAMHLRGNRVTGQRFAEAFAESRGPDAVTLFSTVRVFDDGFNARLPAHTYRHEPSIIAVNWGVRETDSQVFSSDIINSGRRSRAWENDDQARSTLIQQGVWETLVEDRLLEGLVEGDGELRTSFTLFEDARTNPNPMVVLSPETAAEVLAQYDLGADNRAWINQALAMGKHVVFLPGQEHTRFSWWQIDPGTWSATGYLPNGRGATVTEWVIGLSLIALYVAWGAGAFGRCLAQYYQEVKLCSSLLPSRNMKTRTETDFGACFMSQLAFRPRPEPECACGGIGEPACPTP
jgi:adenosyl cobinamide kinase/adenosyl cobinamide phosphate guanylyltransferase